MASLCIHKDNLGKILNYLHLNIAYNIESYKECSFYLFPSYHSCRFRNKNRIKKKSWYYKGEQCINPVHTASWRPVKRKYFGKTIRVYTTRYRKKNLKETFGSLFLSNLLNYL